MTASDGETGMRELRYAVGPEEAADVAALLAEAVDTPPEGVTEIVVRVPADFAERLSTGIDAYRTLLSELAPHGWLVGYEYTPGQAAALLATYRVAGLAGAETRLLADFRTTACEEQARELGKRLVLQDWAEALEMAGRAHDRGEYPLAVPIGISATDGLCRSFLRLDPFKIQSITGSRAKSATERLAPGGSFAPDVAKALMTVLMGFGKRSNPAVLNRHDILHGLKPPNVGERDSAQCVIALRMMARLLDRESRRAQQAATRAAVPRSKEPA